MNNHQNAQSDNNYGQQQTKDLPNLTDNEFPNEDIKESDDTSETHNQEGSFVRGGNSEENVKHPDGDQWEDTDEYSGTSDEDIKSLNQDAGEYNRDHEGGMIEEIGETEGEEGDEDDEDDDVDKDEDINADSEVVDNRDVNETNRSTHGDEGGAGSDSRFPKSV